MKKTVIIILVLILTLIIPFLLNKKEENNPENNYQKITIEEMYKIIDNGLIIDVRTKEEYQEGYVKNSINIPLDTINMIEKEISDKTTQVFIYCRSGVRSKEATEILLKKGYTNVYDIGGILDMNIELVK